MNERCSRLWQVEAARDGRLSGGDADSVARHVTQCIDCASEARRLDALTRAIGELPMTLPSEIGARRQRQRLLASENARRLRPITRSFVKSVWAIAAAGAMLVVALASLRVHRTKPRADSVVVVAGRPGARWSEQRGADIDRVDLTEGAAHFEVHHGTRKMRILITLPDGEIEDLGTVLDVEVQDHQTMRVSVAEGRVALRLRGRAEVILSAGQTWSRPTAPIVAPAPEPTPSAALETPPAPREEGRAGVAASAPSKSASAPRPASVFAPRDNVAPAQDQSASRAEDEAYLRVVELVAAGKRAAARDAAREYLVRFPSGFRRLEVLDVATQP